MPHRSIGVQVASKCRGTRRKLPSAAASQHKVSTVKPTTNKFNMTQRERETAPSKFNSRFIRRFGVCSGLSRCSAAGALDATRGTQLNEMRRSSAGVQGPHKTSKNMRYSWILDPNIQTRPTRDSAILPVHQPHTHESPTTPHH